jgi:hypothetical protein
VTSENDLYVYRVQWRRDTWVAPWRWNVKYYATEAGARRWIERLLSPRPGDALPVRVRLDRARRSDWETVLEDRRDGDELYGDPMWLIHRW